MTVGEALKLPDRDAASRRCGTLNGREGISFHTHLRTRSNQFETVCRKPAGLDVLRHSIAPVAAASWIFPWNEDRAGPHCWTTSYGFFYD